jgi:N-acylneuraminate cytidylyltransferase
MRNIVIIPARGGSKRLPQKNTMILGGIPLLVHSIAYAKKNRAIVDEIYVSTDDSMIKKNSFGARSSGNRSATKYFRDLEPTVTAFLQHVLQSIENNVANIMRRTKTHKDTDNFLFCHGRAHAPVKHPSD